MSSSAPTLWWLPILLRQKSKLLLPPHLPSVASPTITLLLTHSIPSTPTLLLCRESTSHDPSSGPQDMLFPLSCMFQCGFLDHIKIITPIPYIPYPPSLLYFSCSTCQHLTRYLIYSYLIYSFSLLSISPPLEWKFQVGRDLYLVVYNAFHSA